MLVAILVAALLLACLLFALLLAMFRIGREADEALEKELRDRRPASDDSARRRAPLLALHVLGSLLVAGPTLAGADDGDAVRIPNDRLFPRQWQLYDPHVMGAAQAWSRVRGGPITVAVIDSGVELSHPDLKGNLWTNTRELAGNAVDDDANGYVDDVHGWDFVNGDATPDDDNGHGTHVAGIVAARGDNRRGVAGVAWRARLMILKVLGASGRGSVVAVADAVRYAVAQRAKIILLAVHGDEYSPALEDELRAADDADALLVAAAGNDRRDIDLLPTYPAALAVRGLITVGAVGVDSGLTADSNYGRDSVDIAAPGQGILSTARHARYEYRGGTSAAAAHVAGALALLAAAQPGLGADALSRAILDGARATTMPFAAGTLDIAKALQRAQMAPIR